METFPNFGFGHYNENIFVDFPGSNLSELVIASGVHHTAYT